MNTVNKSKKKKTIIITLWIVFIAMIIGITYLSFQNGEVSKELGKQLMVKLTEMEFPGQVLTTENIDRVTYAVRQTGRSVAFLLLGVLGTLTIYYSWPKCNCLIRLGISATVLVAIAYLTEKLKVYLPTRHYSHNEMMISIIAVAVGFLMVTFITLTGRAIKGVARLVTTAHSS